MMFVQKYMINLKHFINLKTTISLIDFEKHNFKRTTCLKKQQYVLKMYHVLKKQPVQK